MFIIYALLVLCFIVQLSYWIMKPTAIPFFNLKLNVECRVDADCSFTNQLCFFGKCIEKETDICNPETGYWIKTADNTLKCVCKKPHLVTQNADGANCSVNIGCGLFGHVVSLDPVQCECDEHFKMGSHGQCIRQKEMDRLPEKCPEGTLHSNSPEAKRYFTRAYLKQFRHKCLRKPCSFNALNHKPLKHTALVQDKSGRFRCLCSPEYGHFGVFLNAQDYLLNSLPGHHNACASIYEEEPETPNFYSFKFYCYFYMDKVHRPVCFIVFESLQGKGLVSAFEGKKAIAVFDEWPHSFDQYVLQSYPVVQKIRACHDYMRGVNLWYMDPCQEDKHEYFPPPPCSETPNNPYVYEPISFANNVYAYYFVCKYDNYLQSQTTQVIVNPYAIDYTKGDRFSHGYELQRYSDTQWKVKPAPAPSLFHLPLDKNTSKQLLGQKWQFQKANEPWRLEIFI